MSSVYVATVFFVVTQAPSQFVFFSVFPVVRPEIIQVVDVSSLCAEYFSEYSLLCHVQGVHFEPVIAAVFQNHAVLASSFRQVDKFPALFQIHSRRNFDGYVLSMLHGILGNREVVIPVGCNVYQVNVFAFAERFISFCTWIHSCFRKTSFLQVFLAFFCTFFFIVTQSYDFSSGNVSKTFYCSRTTHSQSYETYAYNVHFRYSQTDDRLLSGWTFRGFYYDGTFIPFPLSGRWKALSKQLRRCTS